MFMVLCIRSAFGEDKPRLPQSPLNGTSNPPEAGATKKRPESIKVTWNCDRMLTIERNWKKLVVRPDIEKRDQYNHGIDTLTRLIAFEFSDQELHEVAVSMATMPTKYDEQTGFDEHLLQAVVIVSVKHGREDSLIALVSNQCPERIFNDNDIEWYVVMFGRKIKDPILIFGKAYERCQVAEVKHRIAECVRRAFLASGIDDKDDGKLMKKAMLWYKERKDHLVVNEDYADNIIDVGYKYRTRPLFVEKQAEPRESSVIKKE
jgi:hypothetical protein